MIRKKEIYDGEKVDDTSDEISDARFSADPETLDGCTGGNIGSSPNI